ncbi:MAG: cyclic nucleotide-binding domain-containing protein [Desulforhopalus sp.]
MLIDLGTLADGMGKMFLREFMRTADHMCCDCGYILFRQGESTRHFYTLIQGEFSLSIGNNVQNVYTVCHPGDIFGWSSLVGRDTYSATAVCTKPSEILRFDHSNLVALLAGHPACGMMFFKKLAESLGGRLLESYRIIHEKQPPVQNEPETNAHPMVQ